MKKLIALVLAFTMILPLAGCSLFGEPTPKELIKTAREEIGIEELSHVYEYNTDEYSSYVTYYMSEDEPYREEIIILETFNINEETYVKYTYSTMDLGNEDGNVRDTDWYISTKKGLRRAENPPFFSPDLYVFFRPESLNSEYGKAIYPEDYKMSAQLEAEGVELDPEARFWYCEFDMNDDGKKDLLHYIDAPWHPRDDEGYFLMELLVNLNSMGRLVKFDEKIPYKGGLYTSYMFVLPEVTNGLHNVLFEYVFLETGEITRIEYAFNGETYSRV